MSGLLNISGLTVELPTAAGWVRPMNEVSVRIGEGECVGLVGESGSGKTMLSLALMGLLGLTYILISHSSPVFAQMATHIAVMRAGQFVEFGPAKPVLEQPQGDYTKELLAAMPEIPHTGQV